MDNTNEMLTTEQIALRYDKSLRWAQDLMTQNQSLFRKVGREYQAWSHDVDRVVRRSRSRGRPRRLTASQDGIGLDAADVADAVKGAQSEEAMEDVFQEYLSWLEARRDLVRRLMPGPPREVAITNIEQCSRTLPEDQREAWVRVLQRDVNLERRRRIADLLINIYQANVKVRPKNDMDWCVEVYAPGDTAREHPLGIIYEAAVMTDTCGACGKWFGFHEMEMVNGNGVSLLPPLCGACAAAWNDTVDRQPTMATSQQFDQFRRERIAHEQGA